jgi:hypothetical protein
MSRQRLVPAVLLALVCAAAPARADDTTPPGPPQITVDTPLFGFAGEPLGSFECRADGGPWAACVSPWDSGATSEGDHTIEVRQIDDGGNVGDPAAFSWTTAPAEAEADEPAADSGAALDVSQPLDVGQPLAPLAGPAEPSGAPTSQPLDETPAAHAPAKRWLHAWIARHVEGGHLAVRCAVRGAPISRCDVTLEAVSSGTLIVLTGRSGLGHGATLGGGRHTAVVYVRLTTAAARALLTRRSVPVLVHVRAMTVGRDRALTTTLRTALRH